VFLSYIEGNDSARLSHIRPLLDDADDNKLEIVTSALTIVEVAYAPYEKAASALDQSIEDAIAGLWAAGSPIRVVEVDGLTASGARRLVREGIASRRAIKPADAVHLATAMRLQVDALHTYNLKDFQRWQKPTGLAVCHPESDHPQMVAPTPTAPPRPVSQSPTAPRP